MRDRSGRSGRRLGSQKPGTACGAASTGAFGTAWACAAPDARIASETVAIAPASRRLRVLDTTALDDTVLGNPEWSDGAVCTGALPAFWVDGPYMPIRLIFRAPIAPGKAPNRLRDNASDRPQLLPAFGSG